MLSWHVAPFKQGSLSHSLILYWQFAPVYLKSQRRVPNSDKMNRFLLKQNVLKAAILPRRTNASVIINSVDASSSVQTTAFRAIFVVSLAINSTETQRTNARVRIDVLIASGSILAGI